MVNMYLSEFFKNAPQIEVKQLSCDSRVPMKDCIFFCVKGIRYNGHDYVDEAIDNGANIIVYSEDINIDKNAIFIKVNNVEDVLKSISNKFYNYPSHKLETYIISGTNGRSSVSSIINYLLSPIKKVSSIGIFGINYGDINLLSNQPTLTILDNQKTLAKFVEEGCEVTTLEASVLSLSYKKLDMVLPNAFIYTSTSLESREYNDFGSNYFDSLIRYLYTLDDTNLVVLNRDDISYEYLKKASGINCVSYGFNVASDYVISNEQINDNGTSFILKHGSNKYIVKSNLIGIVNIYNVASSLATLDSLGYDMQSLIDRLVDIECIDGVMDRLNFNTYNIYVDCARSIDSYKYALEYAKTIISNNKKIITLVSINTTDNKHRLKHLIKEVDSYSNLLILTEDDTYEDDINETFDIAVQYIENSNYLLIEDREEAIEEAIELLNTDDVLLILGKGNEMFLYKGLVKKNYYGDKNIAYKYMNKRLKEEKNL